MNRNLRSIRLLPQLLSAALSIFCVLVAESRAADGTVDPTAAAAQQKLAPFQGRVDAHALDVAWPFLNSLDAKVREVGRLAVEAQPFDSWKQRALDEKKPWASLEALRALIEACPHAEASDLSPYFCWQLTTLGIEQMSEAQQLAAVQLTRAIFVRLGPVSADERTQMFDLWSHFPEPLTGRAKAEVARLLAFIEKATPR